jgi:hypothetical protein
VIQIRAKARFQRLARKQFEGACAVGLSLGSQEKSAVGFVLLKAAGEFIQVRHKKHFDARLQQRADNLPGNFRALSFVRRGKGFVEQQQ